MAEVEAVFDHDAAGALDPNQLALAGLSDAEILKQDTVALQHHGVSLAGYADEDEAACHETLTFCSGHPCRAPRSVTA